MKNTTPQGREQKWKIDLGEDRLTDPLRWKRPRRVFVNSMSDLFHEAVPFEFVDRVFAVMARCPQHTFQVLTKRPERMAEYLLWSRCGYERRDAVKRAMNRQLGRDADRRLDQFTAWPLPNVWLGTSVEDQPRADERIHHLLRCPGAVRFLSCEPLLGPLDLNRIVLVPSDAPQRGKPPVSMSCLRGWHGGINRPEPTKIDWVIVGGESGPKARPCDVGWIRSIVRQCKDAGVPCFVKQLGRYPRELAASGPCSVMPWVWDDGGENIERWYKPSDPKGGEPAEWPEDLRVREMPRAWSAVVGEETT